MPYKDYEKTKAKAREWQINNPERTREIIKKWRESHREEMSDNNARRLYVGKMYLGMCGSTKREMEKNRGETE